MTPTLLGLGACLCAWQAVRARSLLIAALWLGGVSALLALLLYILGAPEVAVIELSVGTGLDTILFVFAINMAGEEGLSERSLMPRPFAAGLVLAATLLLAWYILPLGPAGAAQSGVTFSDMLWQQRGLDVLVQIGLIFAGSIGILGLLSEREAH